MPQDKAKLKTTLEKLDQHRAKLKTVEEILDQHEEKLKSTVAILTQHGAKLKSTVAILDQHEEKLKSTVAIPAQHEEKLEASSAKEAQHKEKLAQNRESTRKTVTYRINWVLQDGLCKWIACDLRFSRFSSAHGSHEELPSEHPLALHLVDGQTQALRNLFMSEAKS